jgi:FkbM family methyltransferase
MTQTAPTGLRRSLRAWMGVARSVRIYYGSRERMRRMAALYAGFVKPGDLVFDIGSHVGDRIAAFRRLSCRVVAVEPQPTAFRFLKMVYGRHRDLHLVHAAVSDRSGTLTLRLNIANPTVSTASSAFIDAARGASGWEGQKWEETVDVPAVTLDMLIAAHGVPAFAKIDVEGFEHEVLQGLSAPLPALSFEFTTIQRDVAEACLMRLASLGDYGFNIALGESQDMTFPQPISADAMLRHIRGLPHEANSGDVYAVLRGAERIQP